MPYQLLAETKEEYLLIKSTGSLGNLEELRAHSNDTYAVVAKHPFTQVMLLNNTMHYIVDLIPYYELVSFYSEDFPVEVRRLKVALVVAPQYDELGKFWETLCVNRGYNFHSFISEAEALNWLTR